MHVARANTDEMGPAANIDEMGPAADADEADPGGKATPIVNPTPIWATVRSQTSKLVIKNKDFISQLSLDVRSLTAQGWS